MEGEEDEELVKNELMSLCLEDDPQISPWTAMALQQWDSTSAPIECVRLALQIKKKGAVGERKNPLIHHVEHPAERFKEEVLLSLASCSRICISIKTKKQIHNLDHPQYLEHDDFATQVTLGFQNEEERVVEVTLDFHEDKALLERFISQVLFDSTIEKICYDLKFILAALGKNRVLGQNLVRNLMKRYPVLGFVDIALASFILNPDVKEKDTSFNKLALKMNVMGFATLAEKQFSIWDQMKALLKSRDLDRVYEFQELPICFLLSLMQLKGITVNPNLLNKFRDEIEQEQFRLESAANDMIGYRISLSNNSQISKAIYQDLKLLPQDRKEKKYSKTDVCALLTGVDCFRKRLW
jgi:DNA polymerase I-like protein with 3'-5' exonuclease and polymerase domains